MYEIHTSAGDGRPAAKGTMNNSFFALVFRQKYIKRWGLMRNLREESLAEHASETAILTHALCSIGNLVFGKNYNTDRAVTLALFHDIGEVYTGDLPTPIKYFSQEMRQNYKDIEENAAEALLAHLPAELVPTYRPLLSGEDDPLYPLVKAADKLAALIKCLEEEKSGNCEFSAAKKATLEAITALHSKEADYFVGHFLPAFSLSLDEMQS